MTSLAPLRPGNRSSTRLRKAQFFVAGGTPSQDFRKVHRKGGRAAEEFYRERWRHDKVVRSTHGVNCTGSCSWKVYVKDGIITWETQQTDYPSTGPDSPEYEPTSDPEAADSASAVRLGRRSGRVIAPTAPADTALQQMIAASRSPTCRCPARWHAARPAMSQAHRDRFLLGRNVHQRITRASVTGQY